MNPIHQINEDRVTARSMQDPNSDVGFLALVTDGKPSVRTLVLRDISDEGVTLFINKTSPKWTAISNNPACELLIWFQSLQRQYRINGNLEELDRSVIESNWHRRPIGSKYLDYAYQQFGAQSTEIGSRQALVDHIEKSKSEISEDEMQAPESATGIILKPDSIDVLDLNSADRIHDRRSYRIKAHNWIETQLIP